MIVLKIFKLADTTAVRLILVRIAFLFTNKVLQSLNFNFHYYSLFFYTLITILTNWTSHRRHDRVYFFAWVIDKEVLKKHRRNSKTIFHTELDSQIQSYNTLLIVSFPMQTSMLSSVCTTVVSCVGQRKH